MRKNFDTALAVFAILSIVTPALAADDTFPDGKAKPKFHGSVQAQDGTSGATEASATAEPPIRKPLGLQVRLESDDLIGTKNDIFPFYEEKAGVTQAEYQQLLASPLVQARLEEWKMWFHQFYEDLRPNKTEKIPADVRCKIDITVLKNGKVGANVEWMDATENKATKQFMQKYLEHAQNLNPERVKFPDKSYLEMLKLELYLNGSGNSYILGTAQTTAFDYDR